MNKRGVTILELLISITISSIIVLMLVKVIFSFSKINNDDSYASNNEIRRAEIIKNIESDFLKFKLEGLDIINNDEDVIISFKYEDKIRELIIKDKSLKYDNDLYELKSNNASLSKCIEYNYNILDNNYYVIKIVIPVLIDNQNTTNNDDISLVYISLDDENNNFPNSYTCPK